ncbi:MAG: DsrE family protein [Helicobacteraceae bacterium]|nr:DsrE family protein [Candidatus Sulfurimonas ponti]MBL6973345.1 DsrE family protein [Sulfurimonas sp.]
MKNKLLIVWSSGEAEVAKKLVLLYSSVMLERKYWDEATIMIWGPSAKLLAENTDLQEQFKVVRESGVKFNACVVCTDDYGVSDQLRSLGVDLIHTGEMLTEALQNDDVKVITF